MHCRSIERFTQLRRYIEMIYRAFMLRRADLLDVTILGVLSEGPLHGYEVRKRLAESLGALRPVSFGSLYPALGRLVHRGWIEPGEITPASQSTAPPLSGRRARVVYAITGEGKEVFAEWANQPGPDSWDDEGFAAHLAFFTRTEVKVRLRILQGRRSRIEERIAELRESLARSRERMDAYTLRLQEYGLEGAEREVRWLDELITAEQRQSRHEPDGPAIDQEHS